MARMRCVCPACGRLLGVPSGQPSQRGTEADPLEPTQRRPALPTDPPWWAQPDAVAASAAAHESPPQAQPEARPRRRRKRKTAPRGLETPYLLEWFGGLLVGLAFWLTALSAGVFALWLEEPERVPWWGVVPLLGVVAGVAVGCVWGLWWSVLHATALWDPSALRSPMTDLGLVVKGAFVGSICFLTGPVVPVFVACWFWLNSGDLTWVDQFLLAQLAAVAVAGWLLAFAAAAIGGRVRDALPGGVVRLVGRLGWRVVAWACVLGLVVVGHGLLAVFALESSHDSIFSWLLLFVCWTSLLFWMTGLVRWPANAWRATADPSPLDKTESS